MTKALVWTVSVLMPVALALAATKDAATEVKPKKLSPEQVWQLQMKRFGGFVVDTRGQKGTFVIVNAQKAAKSEWFNEPIREVTQFSWFKHEIKDGSFNLPKPEVQGEASLFVVDDPTLPMSLVAPESKWVMVNVAPLKTDKPAFFEARVKKAVVRGLAYLLGAGDSQYPMCVTGCVTKPEDLDQYPAVAIPIDILNKFNNYAKGYGITPSKRATYRQAVHGGWAAQPTNEYQKAIWDQAHEIPTEPMVIKPEKHPAK